MSRIWAIVKNDLRVALRESIVVYVVVAPIVLALGARFLLPLLEAPSVTFAVGADVAAETVALLEAHGAVERFPNAAAVIERVRRIDDVPGVLLGEDGLVEVVLEGNEAAWVAAVPSLVLDAAAVERPVSVSVQSLGQPHSELRYILSALMTFSILLMGGVISGLVVIQEKEEGTLRMYTVSPVSFAEYWVAKTLLAMVPGLLLSWVVAAILLGGALQPGPLLVASVGALPAALLFGYLLSTYASDQVSAVALMKALLFLFTSVPIAGFLVTGIWLTLLQGMTNHWAIQGLYVALSPDAVAPWREVGFSLLTGVPLVAAVLVEMRRRLGFAGTSAPVGERAA